MYSGTASTIFLFEELNECFSSFAIPLGADIKYVSSGIKIKSKQFQFPSPEIKERIELYRSFFFSVGLPVANAPDVPQPCGLLYYP
jgi:hypothetical protein